MLSFNESILSQRLPRFLPRDANDPSRPLALSADTREAWIRDCLAGGDCAASRGAPHAPGVPLCRHQAPPAGGSFPHPASLPGAVREDCPCPSLRENGCTSALGDLPTCSRVSNVVRVASAAGVEVDGSVDTGTPALLLEDEPRRPPAGRFRFGPSAFDPSIFGRPDSPSEENRDRIRRLGQSPYGVSMIPPLDADKFWAIPQSVPLRPLAGTRVWFRVGHDRRDTMLGTVLDARVGGECDRCTIRPDLINVRGAGGTGGSRSVDVPLSCVWPAASGTLPAWEDDLMRDDRDDGLVLQALVPSQDGGAGAVWEEVVSSSGAAAAPGAVNVHRVEYIQVERLQRVCHISGLGHSVSADDLPSLIGSGEALVIPGTLLRPAEVVCRATEWKNIAVPLEYCLYEEGTELGSDFCYVRVVHDESLCVPWEQLRKYSIRLFAIELCKREALAVQAVELHTCTDGCFKNQLMKKLADRLCRMGYPQPLINGELQFLMAQGVAPCPERGKGGGSRRSTVEVTVFGLPADTTVQEVHRLLDGCIGLQRSSTSVCDTKARGRLGFVTFETRDHAERALAVLEAASLSAAYSKRQMTTDRLAKAPPPVPSPVFMSRCDARDVVPSNRTSLAAFPTNQCSKLIGSGKDAKEKVLYTNKYISKSDFGDVRTVRDLVHGALYSLYKRAEKRGVVMGSLDADERLIRILRACMDSVNSNFVLSGPLAAMFWLTEGRGSWVSHDCRFLYLRDCVQPETRHLGANEIQSFKIGVDDAGRSMLFHLQDDYDCRGRAAWTAPLSLFDYVQRVERCSGKPPTKTPLPPVVPPMVEFAGAGRRGDIVIVYDLETLQSYVRESARHEPDESDCPFAGVLGDDELLALCGEDPNTVFRTWAEVKEDDCDDPQYCETWAGVVKNAFEGWVEENVDSRFPVPEFTDRLSVLGRAAQWHRLYRKACVLSAPSPYFGRVVGYEKSSKTYTVRVFEWRSGRVFEQSDVTKRVEQFPSTVASGGRHVYRPSGSASSATLAVHVVSDCGDHGDVVELPGTGRVLEDDVCESRKPGGHTVVMAYLTRGVLTGALNLVAGVGGLVPVVQHGPVPYDAGHSRASTSVQRPLDVSRCITALTPWYRIPRAPTAPFSHTVDVVSAPAGVGTEAAFRHFCESREVGPEESYTVEWHTTNQPPSNHPAVMKFTSRSLAVRAQSNLADLGIGTKPLEVALGYDYWSAFVCSSVGDLCSTWALCNKENRFSVGRYSEFLVRLFVPHLRHSTLRVELKAVACGYRARFSEPLPWPAFLELLRRVVRTRSVEAVKHGTFDEGGGYSSLRLPCELGSSEKARRRVVDLALMFYGCAVVVAASGGCTVSRSRVSCRGTKALIEVAAVGLESRLYVCEPLDPATDPAHVSTSALPVQVASLERLRLNLAVAFECCDNTLLDDPLVLKPGSSWQLSSGDAAVGSGKLRAEFQPWGRARRTARNYDDLHAASDSGKTLQASRCAETGHDKDSPGGSVPPGRGKTAKKAREAAATEAWNGLRELRNPPAHISSSDMYMHNHAVDVMQALYNGRPPLDADPTCPPVAGHSPESGPAVGLMSHAPFGVEQAAAVEKQIRLKTLKMQVDLQTPREPVTIQGGPTLPETADTNSWVYGLAELGVDVCREIETTLLDRGPLPRDGKTRKPLSREQGRAVAIILHSLERRMLYAVPGANPLRLKIVGAAGVGKSAVLHAVESHIRRRGWSSDVLLKTAPSGKAASLIDGLTVDSVVGSSCGGGLGVNSLAANFNDSAARSWFHDVSL